MQKQSVEVGSPETVKIGDVVLNSTAPRRHEKAAKGVCKSKKKKLKVLINLFFGLKLLDVDWMGRQDHHPCSNVRVSCVFFYYLLLLFIIG